MQVPRYQHQHYQPDRSRRRSRRQRSASGNRRLRIRLAFSYQSQEMSRDSAHHAGAKLRVPERPVAGIRTKRLPSGERGDDCQMSHLSHRGDNNFTTTLKPGATLVKEMEWTGTECDPARREACLKSENNLSSSECAYLADPSDVNVIDASERKLVQGYEKQAVRSVRKAKRGHGVHDQDLLTIYSNRCTKRLLHRSDATESTIWSLTHPGRVVVPRVMMCGFANVPFVFDKIVDEVLEG